MNLFIMLLVLLTLLRLLNVVISFLCR